MLGQIALGQFGKTTVKVSYLLKLCSEFPRSGTEAKQSKRISKMYRQKV
jgi:hypothetical protein